MLSSSVFFRKSVPVISPFEGTSRGRTCQILTLSDSKGPSLFFKNVDVCGHDDFPVRHSSVNYDAAVAC